MVIGDKIDPLKRTERLSDLETGIIETLPTINKTKNREGFTIVELRNALVRNAYEEPPLGELKDKLRGMARHGSVRYITDNEGIQHFYLSRYFGSGKREQVALHGETNLFNDTYKLVKRIFGSFFVMIGLGVILYAGLSPTGRVIASTAPSFSLGLLLSFALTLIGIIILFKNSKK